MSESLLSFSEVLLFGRVVNDLQIRNPDEALSAKAATTAHVASRNGLGPVNGVALAAQDNVLVKDQNGDTQNGLYTVSNDVGNTWLQQKLPKGTIVLVEKGTAANKGLWEQKMPLASGKQKFDKFEGRKPGRRLGQNKHLESQLDEHACFARVYGFSYEGTFYELPEPVIFLVHGEGESATDGNLPGQLASRAPNKPPLSGVASADYQIADDIRVWPYDKADYTIRMDVATGMFEQVLLDIFFEVDLPMMAGAKVSGAKVAGAKVAGAKVSGAKVSGAKVAGAKVSGAKVGGFGD